MFHPIPRAILVAALCLTPLAASAQQGPGVGPLSGGPRLDDRRLQDLQRPEFPMVRGTLPANRRLSCTFYEHANYEGKSRRYTVTMGVQPGIFYVTEVAYVGNDFNDMISSFDCDDGCEADLHADQDFQGSISRGYQAERSLELQGLNDQASSLKVKCYLF